MMIFENFGLRKWVHLSRGLSMTNIAVFIFERIHVIP